MRRNLIGMIAACAAAIVAIFAADLALPNGGAAAALYVVPVVCACIVGRPVVLVVTLAAVVVLTIGGALWDTPFGILELSSRGFVVAALLSAAAICYGPMRGFQRLRHLESRIRDRELAIARARSVLERAEVQRHDAERRYAAMFNQTFQLVALLSPQGRIEEVNDTFLAVTGLAREAVSGLEIWELPLYEDDSDMRRRLREGVTFAAQGSFCRLEAELARQERGQERRVAMTLDMSIKPIRTAEGVVETMILEARDITEQKAQATALARRERLNVVGQLASGIAHDINNTLTVISGNLELAVRRLKEEGVERQRVERAIEAVFYGKSLTRRLLAFARRQSLVPAPLALGRVIGETCDLLGPTLPDNIELRLDLEEDLWSCWADAGQLETALMNLALNARDALPDGGCVTVRARNVTLREPVPGLELVPGDYLRISVIDEGEGIPAEIIDRVLEPYFTTKGPDRGTGMGLSMVYGFARQSGGDLAIQSRVGEGTEVHLYLPRAIAGGGEDRGGAEEEAPATTARILLIEDDNGVRDVVVNMLNELGYIVSAVRDGEAACEELGRTPSVDLLLTDIMLPGRVGVGELVAMARKARPDLPVIYSSAIPEEARIRLDTVLSHDNFIAKPYRVTELKRVVARALGHRGAEGKNAGPSARGPVPT